MNERDPTDIHGEERGNTESRRRAKLSAQTEIEDLKWVLSNKRGRRFIWRFLEKAGVFKSSFTGNSETFFREGQRNMGLMVLALINEHTPEAYSLMLKEQSEHERNERTISH